MRFQIRRTAAQGQFRDFDTVYYNNALTAPLFLLLSLLGGDGNLGQFITFYGVHAEERTRFIAALLVSGVAAFWISYASAWCMRVTNSTTYSMVGALNKLPIAVSAMFVFADTVITVGSVGSILLGFVSGVVYTYAKLQYDQENKAKQAASGGPLLGGGRHPAVAGKLGSSSSTAAPFGEGGQSDSFLQYDHMMKGFKAGHDRSSSTSSTDSVAIAMVPLASTVTPKSKYQD